MVVREPTSYRQGRRFFGGRRPTNTYRKFEKPVILAPLEMWPENGPRVLLPHLIGLDASYQFANQKRTVKPAKLHFHT